MQKNVSQHPSAALFQALTQYIDAAVDAKLRAAGAVQAAPDPRTIRIKAGLEIVELAERSGVAHSTISRLERGKIRRPSPHVLDKLASALGVSAAEYRGAVASLIQRQCLRASQMCEERQMNDHGAESSPSK